MYNVFSDNLGRVPIFDGNAIRAFEPKKDYWVKVIDYDGTIIDEKSISTGEIYAIPTPPTHTGLIFDGWSSTETITSNSVVCNDNNILIGAMYKTASGVSEFDIVLTPATGKTITFQLNGTKDWGDGTSDYLQSHTYSDYGEYTITCDDSSINFNVFYSASTPNYSCVAIRIGETVQSISRSFEQCRNVKYITIPSSVTQIDIFAFSDCNSVKVLILPNSITTLSSCCWFLRNVKTIVIPNSITTIGDTAFTGCANLTDIVIPSSVTTIGERLFESCTSLQHAIIPNSVTSVGQKLFYKCSSLISVRLSNNITRIRDSSFEDCISLTEIIIPNSVTAIGTSAFWGCKSLKSVSFSNTLQSIGTSCFYTCKALSSLDLPNTLYGLSGGAFMSCENIERVKMGDLNGFNMQYSAFDGCGNVKIYDLTSCSSIIRMSGVSGSAPFSGINQLCKFVVPDSLYNDWIVATNWVDFADYIYKESEVNL